jgi:photosystem II stability/assembly factor-like uncharacterized protein
MSELSRRGARLLEHPAMAPPPVAVLAARARRYRLWRRARTAGAACTLVALVAVAASGVAWHSAGPAPGPLPYAAAGPVVALPAPAVAPVPAGSAPARGAAGTWRLTGDISLPLSWRRNNGGPAPGYLSCPQAGTCYLAGSSGGGSSSGPGPSLDTLYVSHDGGLSWAAIRLPGGASFTTALACPVGGDCLAGGEVSGQAVLLATGDGGYRWAYRDLPSGDGVINQLACPTVARCRALASSSGQPWALTLGRNHYRAWFLRTDDAGGNWSGVNFPGDDTIGALTCLSAADCVAVGTGGNDVNGLGPGVALRTADGGRTWTAGALPAGMTVPPFSAGSVTCAGTSTCYALGFGPQAGNEVSVVAVSTDGGATWRPLAPPPRTPLPSLSAISCATALDCWIAGEQAVPQVVGNAYNGGSAMILATTDGGATWSKITFAAERLPSGEQADSLMAVGEIACPAVDSCVGIGVVDQGSYHVPVYTNAGS